MRKMKLFYLAIEIKFTVLLSAELESERGRKRQINFCKTAYFLWYDTKLDPPPDFV